jgi:hypothetical protein
MQFSQTEFEAILAGPAPLHLAGLDLSGADFRGRNLQCANFQEANLTDANFADADLGYANLSGANLTRTYLPVIIRVSSLIGTNLCRTDLSTIRKPSSLEGATLQLIKAYLAVLGARFDLTEDEWLTYSLPGPLLALMHDWISPRKQILLACADAGPEIALHDPHYTVAEKFVEGKATAAELASSQAALQREADEDPYFWDRFHNTHADEVFRRQHLLAVALGRENLVDLDPGELPCHPFSPMAEGGANLVREVIGNPFQPFVVDPAWLSWREGTVRILAQRIYDERTFELMPVLADALQDAGCEDNNALTHCRSPGPHVRGCWVLDHLLGKS